MICFCLCLSVLSTVKRKIFNCLIINSTKNDFEWWKSPNMSKYCWNEFYLLQLGFWINQSVINLAFHCCTSICRLFYIAYIMRMTNVIDTQKTIQHWGFCKLYIYIYICLYVCMHSPLVYGYKLYSLWMINRLYEFHVIDIWISIDRIAEVWCVAVAITYSLNFLSWMHNVLCLEFIYHYDGRSSVVI